MAVLTILRLFVLSMVVSGSVPQLLSCNFGVESLAAEDILLLAAGQLISIF